MLLPRTSHCTTLQELPRPHLINTFPPPALRAEAYLAAERRRHWWPQSGPLAHLASAVRRVAGACWRGAGGEDRLLRRACELESGGYAWMARPSIPGRRWRRIGSAAAPPPLGLGPAAGLAAGLQAIGGEGGLDAQRQPPSVAPSGTAGGASSFDAATWQWQPAGLAGGRDSMNGRSSGGDASLAGWGASAPSAAAPGGQQEQAGGGAGPAGGPLLLHPSPFDLSLGGAAAAVQPAAPDGLPLAPAGPPGVAAPMLLQPSLTAAPGLGPPGSSHQSSLSAASGKRPTGGSAGGYSSTLGMPLRLQLPPEEQALLGNSGSQRMFLPWQTAGLQAQAAAAAAAGAPPGSMLAAGQPAGEQLPQWQAASDGASMSVLPSRSGPAELWGADEPPSFAGRQEEDQEVEQRRARRFGLAGGRYKALLRWRLGRWG